MFDYHDAFSRNIGWVTEAEQEKLRNCRVAIGGLGGVGGVHLLTLARLGIGRFTIADFDVFEMANFNRQVGARMSTLKRPKIDVMAAELRDINADAELRCCPAGINTESLDDFLDGVDVYVDGLDFFCFRRTSDDVCRVRKERHSGGHRSPSRPGDRSSELCAWWDVLRGLLRMGR